MQHFCSQIFARFYKQHKDLLSGAPSTLTGTCERAQCFYYIVHEKCLFDAPFVVIS